ncbi:abscisic acid g-protein coupled receptor domain-containing protein [Trichoderma breve]|uniref:Abscisic acid g-protein coupled receptor domain-containing protein n=1 Tax=Trichoderma breve TaxID=2034170 RepID=A0A9W9B7N4_9HYPO|nr:abscisic acid g-protein coupled receptor domain-containing protein [Trichoderma breve]KAJ4855300.1 abscisic acid g-protein coupled receptor domain-containing protein [Trichoderma breve]
MWPFSSSSCDQDACVPPSPHAVTAAALLSALPFAAVFVAANAVAVRLIFPKLSRAAQDDARDGDDDVLPAHAPAALRQIHAEHGSKSWRRRGAAWAFGTTVGLAATLGALIMAEIVEAVDPAARNLALRVTVPALLFMLVVLIPWLECRSLVSSAGWSFQRTAKGKLPRVALGLQAVLFGGWLFIFWSMGSVVPRAEILLRACLERIGVVGISLMALLSGFASVSAPWHTFGRSDTRRRPLTEADVNRKQTGLDATSEMLATKRHRLQYLERKISQEASKRGKTGLVGMVMGSIRGATGEEAEIQTLKMEIVGLEAMEANLSSNLVLMKNQRAASARASTTMGRILLVPSYIFSAYCVYRILATSLTTLRRASSPSASFASSDPINRFLGLLARHWDPKLDQMAWARIISFALSGVILVASANSAIQTFHLFAKWTPGLLRHAQANLALAVGQVAATYVISASLLLRSQLPSEARSAVGGVLRGALTPAFVDGWFEGWFLLGSVVTGVGIFVGGKISAIGEADWDDYGMEEMGAKRS